MFGFDMKLLQNILKNIGTTEKIPNETLERTFKPCPDTDDNSDWEINFLAE